MNDQCPACVCVCVCVWGGGGGLPPKTISAEHGGLSRAAHTQYAYILVMHIVF